MTENELKFPGQYFFTKDGIRRCLEGAITYKRKVLITLRESEHKDAPTQTHEVFVEPNEHRPLSRVNMIGTSGEPEEIFISMIERVALVSPIQVRSA